MLYHEHNHELGVLAKVNCSKDSEIVTKETEENILNMYARGHNPRTVHDILHFDDLVKSKLEDNYSE